MATLIKAQDSKVSIVHPKAGDGLPFTLKEMQHHVGGYIEIVRLKKDKVMVVNEEGLLMGLPDNSLASFICRRRIVGDVLIIDNKEID